MKKETICYINGTWVPCNKAMIPFTDAGFQYGDGLFETIRFQKKRLFRPEKHLERLRSGLKILQLDPGKSDSKLTRLLEESVSRNELENGLVKLIITRGMVEGNPWSYHGPAGLYITIRPFSPIPSVPVRIVFLEESSYPLLRFNPAIKSVNYLGNMLAKKDAEKAGAFEPVFYNDSGWVTEGAIRNVFFIRNKTVITPPVELGVLPGVMRDTIREITLRSGLDFQEKRIAISKVNSMDEAFISSTGVGILPCFWDNWTSNYQYSLNLRQKLNGVIDGKTAL